MKVKTNVKSENELETHLEQQLEPFNKSLPCRRIMSGKKRVCPSKK